MIQPFMRFRIGRTLRGCSLPLLLSLVAFSGCTDEVGGDGWVPPRPATMGGSAGSASGGDGDGGDDTPMTGGKGGSGGLGGKGGSSGGKGGRGGSGGRAGSGMTDGGEGGEPPSGPVCGNGVKEEGEECDDGNTKSFDGCPADCRSSCEVCERTFCPAVRSATAGDFNWVNSIELGSPDDIAKACRDLPGKATTGTAVGESRAELCQTALDCMRRERCAQFVPDDDEARDNVFLRCFLDIDIKIKSPGFVNRFANPDSYAVDPVTGESDKGACYREILDASEQEGNAQGKILQGMYNKARPFGLAHLLLQGCNRKLCTEECFPNDSVGEVTTIAADILSEPTPAGESALGDLMVDSLRAATGTDFALLNDAAFTWGYSSIGFLHKAAPGRPADADGRVLESEVRHVFFGMLAPAGTNADGGTKIVTLSLTGQRLYDLLSNPAPFSGLQVSGLDYTWDASTPPKEARVIEIRKGGAPIDKSATFTVTMSDQLANGFGFGSAATVTDKNPYQELIKYLQGLPKPVAPPTLNRITRLN